MVDDTCMDKMMYMDGTCLDEDETLIYIDDTYVLYG
jgi:hypothetical protein